MTQSRSLLSLILGASLTFLTAPSALADPMPVPSGQPVTLDEILMDPQDTEFWMRYRFVAPEIARDGGTISYEVAVQDMAGLCRDVALPQLLHDGQIPDQVIISLSDRPVPFGESAPEATQYFEAFRIEGETCVVAED